MFDDVSNVENVTVVGWDVDIRGEKEVAPGLTVGMWFAEVAGITVGCKNHVTGMISENSFLLSGQLIKELHCVRHSVLCRFGRL